MTDKTQRDIGHIINFGESCDFITGIILCDSLARGTESNNSDIDILVVVTEDEFKKRSLNKDFYFNLSLNSLTRDIDGKIVTAQLIYKAVKLGPENIRSTLLHSKIIYDTTGKLKRVLSGLKRSPNSTEDQKLESMITFYSLMKSSVYSGDSDPENRLLVQKCKFDTIFYASRLILAFNNIYYPCVKNLTKAIKECENIPNRYLELLDLFYETNSYSDLFNFYFHIEDFFKELRFEDRLRKGWVIENELFWFFNIYPYSEK